MSDTTRYDVSCFIGPCTEAEAEALADRILGLPEFKAVGGGGVSVVRVADPPGRPSARREQILAALAQRPMTVPELVAEVLGAWDEKAYGGFSVEVRRLVAERLVEREPSKPRHPGLVRLIKSSVGVGRAGRSS